MYKLTVFNNKFRLFAKREVVTAYSTVEELMKGIEAAGDKSYYVTDENGQIIDINDLLNNEPKEEVYEKTFKTNIEGIDIIVKLKENKFNHEIKSKLKIDNKIEFYRLCLEDHKLFSKIELYDHFKDYLTELKDIELAYMVISMIFNG